MNATTVFQSYECLTRATISHDDNRMVTAQVCEIDKVCLHLAVHTVERRGTALEHNLSRVKWKLSLHKKGNTTVRVVQSYAFKGIGKMDAQAIDHSWH